MIRAFRRRGKTKGPWRGPGLLSSGRGDRGFHLTAWLLLAGLATLAAGCGSGSAKNKESTAVAQNQPAQDEEKEAAAEAPPPPAKKKQKPKLLQAAEKTEPAAPSTNDIRKWKAADLDAAFARKDLMFALAVVFYSAADQNDAKRAEELDQLIHKVARMKDDSTIPLPLPPGSFAPDKQSATASAPPGAAAKEAPAEQGMRSRFGKGRKRNKDD